MLGKTVIAIAHRLSTIARMDRLVVMDAGRIVEEGTHEELLRAGGHYALLWKRQSGGFLANDVPDVVAEPDDEVVEDRAADIHPDAVEEPQVRV
jgi:ATP-binding cassette subfamily B multidrug efflux pump